MSEEIHEGTLTVTVICGPADGRSDRAVWQITLPFGQDYIQLGVPKS